MSNIIPDSPDAGDAAARSVIAKLLADTIDDKHLNEEQRDQLRALDAYLERRIPDAVAGEDRRHQVSLLETRLAGCLTAAESGIAGADPMGVIVDGTYGWSPAYQAVIDLHARYTEERALVAFYRSAALCGEGGLLGDADAVRAKVRATMAAQTVLAFESSTP